MNRRALIGRLAAGMAAVVGAGMVKTAAASDESQRIQALHDDMLAHPEQYPELWERVREMTAHMYTPRADIEEWMSSSAQYVVEPLPWTADELQAIVAGSREAPAFEVPPA